MLFLKKRKDEKIKLKKVICARVSMLSGFPKKETKIFNHYKSLNTLRCTYERHRKRTAFKLGNPRLRKITFHTLRHWKATTEYHRTKDILYVMKLLGHKNIKKNPHLHPTHQTRRKRRIHLQSSNNNRRRKKHHRGRLPIRLRNPRRQTLQKTKITTCPQSIQNVAGLFQNNNVVPRAGLELATTRSSASPSTTLLLSRVLSQSELPRLPST
jgi:hypothetical protein